MSLTSEIRKENSALNIYFKGNFTKLAELLHADNNELAKCGCLVPSNMRDYPWKEVGHMVEYLICMSIGISVDRLMPMTYLKQSQGFSAKKLYNDIINAFNCSLNAESLKFSEQCKYLWILADIEASLRSTGKIDFKINYPELPYTIVEDIKNIFNTSIKGNQMLMGRYTYNPKFVLSPDVGGADADLIKLLDSKKNILIDIKTTKSSKIEVDWIYQLVGYTFLDKINYFKIDELAIFMPRQNVMLNWSLEEVILKGSNFDSIKSARREFVKAVKAISQ